MGWTQVDTKLFDLDSASSLLDMLRRGIVQLKRPGGQGLLRLYSDNEVLDEWSAGGGKQSLCYIYPHLTIRCAPQVRSHDPGCSQPRGHHHCADDSDTSIPKDSAAAGVAPRTPPGLCPHVTAPAPSFPSGCLDNAFKDRCVPMGCRRYAVTSHTCVLLTPPLLVTVVPCRFLLPHPIEICLLCHQTDRPSLIWWRFCPPGSS